MTLFLCPWCETESGMDAVSDDAAIECPVCLTVVVFAPDPADALALGA